MKVLGLDIRRSSAPTPGAKGADSWYYDALSDLQAGGPDVNPQLSGLAKYAVYDEMRLSNPAVKSTLWMFNLPVRSARWDFDPASSDPLDELVADACRWQFGLADYEGQLDRSWDEQLQQMLLMLPLGVIFEEDVWAADVATFRDKDGDEHTIRPLARIAPRFPSTVEKTRTDQATGRLVELKQSIPGAQPIPGEKLSAHVLEREGTNWFGTSIMRPMWGPWRLQKALMIGAGIGWDRFAAGTPIIWHPPGDAARRKAQQIGRDLRNHERGYVAIEGPQDASQWAIDNFNGSTSLADPVPLLRWYSEQIAVAGLQQFSSLGGSQHGSRAVGDVLVEPFYMAVQTIAKQVAAERHRTQVRRFVDYNFGPQVAAPRLKVSKIQTRGLSVLTEAIYQLSAGGFSFADRGVQDDIREQLDLPKLPDDVAIVPPGSPNGVQPPSREGDGLHLPPA